MASASEGAMPVRNVLKYLFTACGIALFVHLILSVGAARVWRSVQRVSWGTLALIAVGGCILLLRSLAWRFALGRENRNVPLPQLFRVYVASEAMGFLFFGGPAVADTIRVLMLRGTVPTIRVISSVTLDRGLYLAASAIILAATLLLLPLALHGGDKIPTYEYIIAIVFTIIMAAIWIAMRKRKKLISGTFLLLLRLRPLSSRTRRWQAAAAQVEETLFHFVNTDRPGLWAAFGLNLTAHSLAVGEVWLALTFLGATSSPFIALLIEGMTKIANISGGMIPGNIGAYEGANMVMLKLLGFEPAVGLVLALARDLRRIFWVGMGLVLFLASGYRRATMSSEITRAT
jgi:hypothetical protein